MIKRKPIQVSEETHEALSRMATERGMTIALMVADLLAGTGIPSVQLDPKTGETARFSDVYPTDDPTEYDCSFTPEDGKMCGEKAVEWRASARCSAHA